VTAQARPPAGTHQPAPGIHRRRRRQLHYELLACGVRGHELVGQDAAELRAEDHLFAREADGLRWHRCLRCDSWLALTPPDPAARRHPPRREEIALPLRGKALRDKVVLRLIAVNRAFHFVVLGALGVGLLVFAAHQSELRGGFYRVLSDLQGPVSASTQHPHGLVSELQKLLSAQVGTLQTVAAVALAYALLEGAEAFGLWYQRRWAEYLTFLATTALLPLEVYELVHRLSPFKVGAFVINVAVVIYLLRAKRLFGVHGGAAADLAERERDSGWAAVELATPAPGTRPTATAALPASGGG
jgi:uncharacterized membrane protein (DUF2068 family)